MVFQLGEVVPNLHCETTHGKFNLHDFIGGNWVVMFAHPGDFTPVCTTELGKMAELAPEFDKRGVKLLGISCDSLEEHKEWVKDIQAYQKIPQVPYPIIADPSREIAKQLSMLDYELKNEKGLALTNRALHIIGPDKKLKLSIIYPASTGRNVDEVLRVVDALQTSAMHGVATPVNWKPGEKVIIGPSVTQEEARKNFPNIETVNLPSGKPYLRMTEVAK